MESWGRTKQTLVKWQLVEQGPFIIPEFSPMGSIGPLCVTSNGNTLNAVTTSGTGDNEIVTLAKSNTTLGSLDALSWIAIASTSQKPSTPSLAGPWTATSSATSTTRACLCSCPCTQSLLSLALPTGLSGISTTRPLTPRPTSPCRLHTSGTFPATPCAL